jgi:hypothetical protein
MGGMMLFLMTDVTPNRVHFVGADTERAIRALPLETAFGLENLTHHVGGRAFHIMYHVRHCDSQRHPHQNVNMIVRSTDFQWLALENTATVSNAGMNGFLNLR